MFQMEEKKSKSTSVGVECGLLSNISVEQLYRATYQKINRTKLEARYSVQAELPDSCIGDCHYPCLCIICDRFI